MSDKIIENEIGQNGAYAVEVKDEEIGRRIVDRFFVAIDGVDIPELKDRKIHISLGAAFYNAETEETFEELYQRADSGTYISKKQFGNTVTFQ